MPDTEAWLRREIEREQGREVMGPTQYTRADFREVRRARGEPRTMRFVNRRVPEGEPGHNVPRRRMQKLIGRPLPKITKQEAMDRVAERLESGITVKTFEAQIQDQGSGGRRGRSQTPRSRHREMREPIDVPGDGLEGVTEALREGDLPGASEELQYAALRTWWNGGEADIEDVEDFEAAI